MNRLSWKDKTIYAMGGFGYATVTIIHMLYLVYYFFPPKDSGIPYFIPQGSVLFGITVLGLIMGGGRLLDAVTDPLIATWSDNTKSPLGRRIPFLRYSALGFALSYVMVFFVPVQSGISGFNIIWIIFWMVSSAIFLTLYTVPHTALMVEIARHPDDRIDLATLNSVLWFAGFLLVSFSGSIWGLLMNLTGMDRAQAMRLTFAGIGVLGFTMMMIPALKLKEDMSQDSENIKVSTEEKKQPMFQTMKKVFRNREFSIFLTANTLYTMSTFIFETGLIYYITVLARLDAATQGPITTAVGVITLISYPFVNRFAKKLGKKHVLNFGFALFILMFAAISLLGLPAVPIWLAMGLVILFAPTPQSIFGTLPNAITGDCAAYDEKNSGENSAAMYYAVNGFVIKLGGTLSTLVFTSLLLLGKDVGNDLGIRMAAILGGSMALAGLLVMTRYDERKILSRVL